METEHNGTDLLTLDELTTRTGVRSKVVSLMSKMAMSGIGKSFSLG